MVPPVAVTPGGFPPASYEEWFTSPLGRQVWRDERKVLLQALGSVARCRVLDVGAGDGRFAVELADRGAWVVALDRDRAMLRLAAERARSAGTPMALVVADARALPFRADAFDAAVAVTLLCLVADPSAVVQELARVIRPGGYAVVGELGRWSTWALGRWLRGRVHDEAWAGVRFWRGKDLEALLSSAGLRAGSAVGAVFYPRGALLGLLRTPMEPLLSGRRPFGAAFIVVRGEKACPADA
ncbi:MAG: class I SAM-dependent methyltransferase [Gemmatimonadales bacterium]